MPREFILIFVAAIVVISILSHLARKRGERIIAERIEGFRQTASLHGWTLEIEEAHLVYRGTLDGIPWQFRTTRPYYTSRPATTRQVRPSRWETTAVKIDRDVVQVWPSFGRADIAKAEALGVPPFVRDLFFRPITAALGAPAGDSEAITNIQVVESDDPELRDAYFFRASTPEAASRFLSPEIRRALRDAASWLDTTDSLVGAHHLVILILWKHGLQIVVSGSSHDPDFIGRLATVGATIARAIRSGE